MSKQRAQWIVERLEALGEPFEEAPDCPWLDRLETAFGVRLPEPLRSLVEHYRWAEFEVGPLSAFGNLGDRSHHDLLKAPFSDKPIFVWLRAHGLLQIGRLASGSYDPVCLDLAAPGEEPSIVVVDHEDILLCRRKVRVSKLAESLESLVEAGSR